MAASVILAITGVQYALWYDDIVGAKGMTMPPHKEDRGNFKKCLSSVLWSRAVPLFLSTLCIFLVYLPPSIGIFISSFRAYMSFGFENLYNYDPIATSFILVEFFTTVLTIQSIIYVWKIFSKLRASEH